MPEESGNPLFPETRWTMVLALRNGGDTTIAHRALEELCRMYWPPLYGYARRLGNNTQDAEDLTQGFIEHVLTSNMLSTADEAVGKLRSFLRKSFSNYIRNNHRSATAQSRGGNAVSVPLDSLRPVELEVEQNAVDNDTPDALFDRLCALSLIEASFAQLEAENNTPKKKEVFAAFRPFLDPQNSDKEPQESLAQTLGISLSNVRTTLFRLRQRFRELLRSLVRDTLNNPTEQDITEELRSMRNALFR